MQNKKQQNNTTTINFSQKKVLKNLEDTAEKALREILRWRRTIDFDDNQRTSGPGICTFPLYQL